MFRTLLALSLPALLMAQGGPGSQDAGQRADRMRIITRLHMIRSQRIKASLGVPDTLAAGIADRWGQFDMDSHKRRQGMHLARQRVQDLLVGPGSEEEKNAKLVPVLAQLAAFQNQQRDAKQRFEDDIQRMLTPVQQGRFIILMEDFQRNLMEALGERRER